MCNSTPHLLADGQDCNTKTSLDINFPRRVVRQLALSTDQKTQLDVISSRFQDGLLTADLEKQRAFTAMEKAIMNALDDDAVKQRRDELVAASAKRVQVYAEMLKEWRKVLTPRQLTVIRPELPLERNDVNNVNVQLPERFGDIDLSWDQNSHVGTVVSSRVPKMMKLNRKEKAARKALEQTICSEHFDEAAVSQHREELIKVIAEQIEVDTSILLDARKILTPSQSQHLNEITPEYQ